MPDHPLYNLSAPAAYDGFVRGAAGAGAGQALCTPCLLCAISLSSPWILSPLSSPLPVPFSPFSTYLPIPSRLLLSCALAQPLRHPAPPTAPPKHKCSTPPVLGGQLREDALHSRHVCCNGVEGLCHAASPPVFLIFPICPCTCML